MSEPRSRRCTVEIEAAGQVRTCSRVASWSVFVSLDGKTYSYPIYRCEEHIGFTLEFHLGEPTTEAVRVIRLSRAANVQG